jgi:hypothetical protein
MVARRSGGDDQTKRYDPVRHLARHLLLSADLDGVAFADWRLTLAQYLALSSLYLGGAVIEAGTRFSDQPSDIYPQLAPTGWLPATGAVEPISVDAVQLFWEAGPYPPGKLLGRRPTTYWACVSPVNAGNLWQLTGLGSGLPPKQMYIGQGGMQP